MTNTALSEGSPLVSIAMSVRNNEQTIALAIKSILGQSYSNWELIVLDDGSTDGTLDQIRVFTDSRIRLVAERENRGLAARLNQVMKIAGGKYIARMDGDDISCPRRFARQVEFLESNPDIHLVGSGAVVFSEDGIAVGTLPVRRTHDEICAKPWLGFHLPHPTWMGRREWFLRYGYREDVRRAQDQEMLLRAYRFSRFACLCDTLVGYRHTRTDVRHVLIGRYQYARALWRHGVQSASYRLAIKGVATQVLRGVVAAVAAGVGAGGFVRKRRFAKPGTLELSEWSRCWLSLARNGDR